MGRELLPAAPLQPCAGGPSGRGHLFSGWVNLAPCNFSSNNVLLAAQAWGTPSAWRHVQRPPIRWVSSGRWVISKPCQYIPCPLLPTTSSRVFSAHHNITHYFVRLACSFWKNPYHYLTVVPMGSFWQMVSTRNFSLSSFYFASSWETSGSRESMV